MRPIPDDRSTSLERHWEDVYTTRASDQVSWFQAEPRNSIELITRFAADESASIIDVGGGASRLVDHLADAGYHDLTVLDVSEAALQVARDRLGERAGGIDWLAANLLTWTPARRYDLWHDRAVFHFLTEDQLRSTYREVMRSALHPGGVAVVATFAEDGPEQCSGLPTARYSPTGLAEALGSDLTVLTTRREEHITPAGVVQPFNWVVLRSERSH